MLLGLLIVLALAGISLMAAVDVWTLQRQREREEQLMYAGDQYRQAIRRYYFAAPPGSPRVLPLNTELLLEDDRYPIPVRHLRRLYPDPITGTTEWGEIRIGERLAGVYSLSEAKPIKQAGFSPVYESFSGKSSYREWVFSLTGAPAANPVLPPPPDKPFGPEKPAKGSPSFSTRSVFGNPK
jgi:type II secretory pathway pseudopilin PulG